MKTNVTGIEFIDPKININWKLTEEDLVNILKCERNDSHFYIFEAKLYPIDIDVFSRITFNDFGYKMEIIVSQTKQERDKNSKAIYIDTNNMNILHNYVEEKFGSPKFFSKLISIINKPFYNHRWTFDDFKLSHKYQDSVIGFYECLLFDVKY
ncbi:hypothetical protein [Mariniplasma anaerobium]|nr:hypothetical protein [Mariniplasma anaerobium]